VNNLRPHWITWDALLRVFRVLLRKFKGRFSG
jgi:hypothetical protein